MPAPSSGLDFILDYLGVSPDATLEQVRHRAQLEGRRIHVATYRRARVQLGLDPAFESPASSALEREPELAPATAPPAAPRLRGGRSPSEAVLGAEALVESVEALVAERDRLRGALERIRESLRGVLNR